jgi:hypothetical protein
MRTFVRSIGIIGLSASVLAGAQAPAPDAGRGRRRGAGALGGEETGSRQTLVATGRTRLSAATTWSRSSSVAVGCPTSSCAGQNPAQERPDSHRLNGDTLLQFPAPAPPPAPRRTAPPTADRWRPPRWMQL